MTDAARAVAREIVVPILGEPREGNVYKAWIDQLINDFARALAEAANEEAAKHADCCVDRQALAEVEQRYQEEKRIVDRVWRALGIKSYEDAKPYAIDDHVERLKERAQRAEWKCSASATSDPPQDCDMPFCGCNPAWHDALESARESGWLTSSEALEVERQLAAARQEAEEWRTKALVVDTHPAVVALKQERDAARQALERAKTFLDVTARAWLPSDHTTCWIDSGCSHGRR